jgi:hypothetical protein
MTMMACSATRSSLSAPLYTMCQAVDHQPHADAEVSQRNSSKHLYTAQCIPTAREHPRTTCATTLLLSTLSAERAEGEGCTRTRGLHTSFNPFPQFDLRPSRLDSLARIVCWLRFLVVAQACTSITDQNCISCSKES